MSNNVNTMIPKAAIKPYVHEIHGHQRNDDYFWLRDDERKDPEVLAYLNEENYYTDQVMSPLSALQKDLYDEMVARQEPELESVPYFKKEYWYISRFNEGQDYSVYSRHKETMEGEEQIFFDCNERAAGLAYYQLGGLSLSPNSRLLAFTEDTVSRRQYTLRFKDLQTNEVFIESINDVTDVVWANDNKTVFYVKQHAQTLLSYQVYRHILGDSPNNDVLIYEEQDDTFSVNLYKTRSEDYLVICLDSTTTSECLVLDANQPLGKFDCFLARQRDHEYSLDYFQGKFFIYSNHSGKNFALHTLSIDNYLAGNNQPQYWDTVVPARESVLLEGYELMQDWLIVEERELGLPVLRQINFQTGESKTLSFNDPVYTVFSHNNPQPNSSKFRYQYTSFTTPATVYELDLDTGETTLLKQSQVMGDFKAEDYQSERVWVTARDGVEVPVSLVYKCSLFDHRNPLLIYAYGSYGHSLDIGFSSSNLSLLDRGFVYAVAHVRGGEELGREWYEQGKLLNKKNSFNDFIDVSKALVEQHYGAKDKVFAMGGSAGGLLMGGVINQAPELYRGVVAAVPFVDVVSTMLDDSIPLTTGEYDEWGNPNDPEYYDYILSYSPYDQVTAKAYPNMLVTTGLHDSQVQYWEPAKWVAKLRALKTDNNQLLLYTDMEAGHGGKSGRFQHFKDTAREFAFLIDLAELEGSL
ncbi:S9 family peptidase [Psychromonas sp. PT13]|uniref:S9 family peptidase n=1 Tax=Psychromonas sp. PT13 TaxID=3439547 RepID=UPI003EBD2BE3